jgi:hypothetical protein
MALIGQGAMSYRAAQQAVENPLYQLNHFAIKSGCGRDMTMAPTSTPASAMPRRFA